MTENEYLAQKADLEAQLATLEQEYLASGGGAAEYPCWMYHETNGSVVVNSEEEATALGAGWTKMPAGTPVDPPADTRAKTSAPKEKPREDRANDRR